MQVGDFTGDSRFILFIGTQPDPFSQHFEVDLEEDVIEKLENRPSVKPVKVSILFHYHHACKIILQYLLFYI